MDLKFTYTIGAETFRVIAEKEGDARYTVRLLCPAKALNVRIGCLMGARRNWVAEFIGSRPSIACKSAKTACEALAKWAVDQPGGAKIITAKGAAHA